MRLHPLLVCGWLLGALWSGAARADDSAIGYVKTVVGEAAVVNGATPVVAQPGTPVYLGSRLSTGAKSSLGVSFKDDTVMALGANTELSVDAYLYAPEQGQLKLVARMLRGSLNYVSGLIAKLRPEAVSVKTPTGIIGVRGTQFVVKVDGSTP